MKLVVKRTEFGKKATFGKLFYNGRHIYDTLEPTDRAIEETGIKLKGQTAIPIGEYKFKLWDSPKFGYRCLRLLDVPYFTDILVHSGNYPTHTQGCILIGERHGDMLINSREAMQILVSIISGRHDTDLNIQITR